MTLSLETIDRCPVCNSNSLVPFLTCKDYLVSQKDFVIQRCQKCSFQFTNPRPDSEEIGSYYKSEQYVSHNDQSSGLINTAYRVARNFTLNSKVNLVNKINGNAGHILDVGCGTGTFLENCKEQGWQIVGVEPDAEAARAAITKLQIDIPTDISRLERTDLFDIITLWHVLEHIPDLDKTIHQLYERLADDGTLLIAVPNSDSYDAQYFKQYWAAYDVPRHLHHFTPKTIELLFKEHSFSLVDKKPMVLDAFYIALLSTRYQTGKTNYLKSVQIGLQSNIAARRTGNSSSQIYLFKKA